MRVKVDLTPGLLALCVTWLACSPTEVLPPDTFDVQAPLAAPAMPGDPAAPRAAAAAPEDPEPFVGPPHCAREVKDIVEGTERLMECVKFTPEIDAILRKELERMRRQRLDGDLWVPGTGPL